VRQVVAGRSGGLRSAWRCTVARRAARAVSQPERVTVAARNEAIAAAHTIGVAARRGRAASAARKRSFTRGRPRRGAGTLTRPVTAAMARTSTESGHNHRI
jgi:hypothetical protein